MPATRAPSELPAAAGTERRHASTAATRPAVTATITPTALQCRERERLRQEHDHQRRDAERAGGPVAHHLERALRRAVAAKAVGGVGQPVGMQAAGGEQEHGHREHAAQRL